LHRFAVFTSGATLFLIFVGGLVTSTGSALAVPDWPLAYGQIFPKMVGGVFFEHGHRMVAAAVGLLMTVLACWIFAVEKRRWVSWLAAGALAAVVLQGVLGGITVLFLLPPAVSVAHACLAQAFFCLTVTLAVVTGSSAVQQGAHDARLRRLAIALTGSVYVQLILGAIVRHNEARSGVAFHVVWAACVTVLMALTVAHVVRHHRLEPLLLRPALLAAGLLAAQIALGIVTLWSDLAVIPTTAHVACGAAVLASSLVLTLRSSLRLQEALI